MLAGGLGGERVLKGREAVCPYTLEEEAYTRPTSCVCVGVNGCVVRRCIL